MRNEHPIFGEVIHVVTREELYENGDLIDVSKMAKEAGINVSSAERGIKDVAVSRRVWNEVITPDETASSFGESEEGRLWDVLWMMVVAAKKGGGQVMEFPLFVTEKGKHKEIKLKSIIGPGDCYKPVITILMPDED